MFSEKTEPVPPYVVAAVPEVQSPSSPVKKSRKKYVIIWVTSVVLVALVLAAISIGMYMFTEAQKEILQNPAFGPTTVQPASPTTKAAITTDIMSTLQHPAVGPTTVTPGSPTTEAASVTDTMTTPYHSTQSSSARVTTTQIGKSYVDCTNFTGLNGLYHVNISGKWSPVYCDLLTPGGGWLVFQRRVNGSVDFYRNWTSYQNGFGDNSFEFWLGLDRLYELTSARNYKLRIDLADFNGNHRYAEYSSFNVGSPTTYYQLNVGTYSGDASDCLSNSASPDHIAQGMQFTTFDADHDRYLTNCAVLYRGAWWYNSCHISNLNGAYLRGAHTSYADGIEWYYWTGYHYSLQFTEMKISAIN